MISHFLKISKNENIEKNQEKWKFEILKEGEIRSVLDERHSTSPPCGNLVDGLPHDCHSEPRSIGSARHPRTSVNFVIAFLFLIKFYIMVTSFVLLNLKISY